MNKNFEQNNYIYNINKVGERNGKCWFKKRLFRIV